MAASDDPRARSVAVVGAGVSGLVATYRLSKSGMRVTVFEADDRAGGKIRTNSDSGYLWDEGANTMTESALEASRLIDYLGLEDRLQYPNSQHKRYTVKDGAPELIPSDPIALMKSSLLSTKSKFKLFLEPFLYEKSSTKNSKKVSDEHISERKCRRDAACLLLKTEGRTTNRLYMSSPNHGAANLVAQLVAIISCSLFAAENEKKI